MQWSDTKLVFEIWQLLADASTKNVDLLAWYGTGISEYKNFLNKLPPAILLKELLPK
jgi:hypothetical protein